jgi:hypothetical protein
MYSVSAPVTRSFDARATEERRAIRKPISSVEDEVAAAIASNPVYVRRREIGESPQSAATRRQKEIEERLHDFSPCRGQTKARTGRADIAVSSGHGVGRQSAPPSIG